MSNKYSIDDLCKLLGRSRTAINRKIKKHNFDTVQEYVNGRSLKLVILSNDQLEALRKEVEFTSDNDTVIELGHDTKLNNITQDNTTKTVSNIDDIMDRLMDHSETVLQQVRHYADRLIESEKEKVQLLTADSEFYKNEYFRLKFENEQLKADLEKYKAKWWNKPIFKK